MKEIRTTYEFDKWLKKLKDQVAKAKITARIQRLAFGNAGDVKPIGKGLSEMRIDYGPGYRVYYAQQGDALVFLLCAGDKSTQADDIAKAKALAAEIEE